MSRQPEPEAERPQERVNQSHKNIGAVSAPTAGYNQRVSKPNKIVLNKANLGRQQRKARVVPAAAEAVVNVERIPVRVAKPYKKRYNMAVPKSNLSRRYDAARVVPAAAVTQKFPAHGEHSREHENGKQDAGIAIVTGPATHQLRRKRKTSRHGTVMNILHDDDLDLEADLETLEAGETVVGAYVDGVTLKHGRATAERSAYDTFDAAVVSDPVDEKPTRTPSSDSQQTPEPEPDEIQPRKRRCGKRWWRQQLAELWYITRKEHAVIAMLVPLHEELAVLTRLQSLLCFYVEIQLALAAGGLFLGTSQTASNAAFVAFLSMMLVSPASLVLPYMFTTSQTIVSTTVLVSRQNRRNGAAPRKRRRSSVGLHTVVARSSEQQQKSQTAVVPFSLPKHNAKATHQSLDALLGRGASNKITPAHAATRDENRMSPPKMNWLSAGNASKVSPVKKHQGRKPSAFAAKMLRKKKRDLQFNKEVRMMELDYYAKHLYRSRKTMLMLSYAALAMFLSAAFCKLVLSE